jgi:glycine betaine/proline transport system permease protein
MTLAVGSLPAVGRRGIWGAVWLGSIVATVALLWLQDQIPWLGAYPDDWTIPIADWINGAMQWVMAVMFTATRAVSTLLAVPLNIAFGLLSRGFTISLGDMHVAIPRLSWIGVTAAAAIAGHAFGGWRLALGMAVCFAYLALFGQWNSAMLTLALILVCVPLGAVTGLLVGILGYRHPSFHRVVIVPLLDVAQATPQFAYLVPMLILFGNNPVSAMLATLIFAIPPMVRATVLALNQVPPEIRDFGQMVGCTKRQLLWRVLVPSARPLIMLGINQVIMMTLNMVIIASMIGAGGLGFDVLVALRALKVGRAIEAGMAIVLLAIALDRLSQAAAMRLAAPHVAGLKPWERYPHLILALIVLAATTMLSPAIPLLARLPDSATITTAPLWDAGIKWITVNFFDALEAARVWLLVHILIPVKAALLALPWLAVIGLLGLAGLQLGGRRLGLLAIALTGFCAVTGLWEKTMITVYLCGISTLVACAIGIPLGILSARSTVADRIIGVVVDTLQTIPAFVYLIPAVMLFRVGDVAAMIGIVLYALTPAIRYTNHGIRQVSPELVEASLVCGCTRGQLLRRVQLPLALAEILLGINQVILLALAMDIIAAMVGTRDLGQEVFSALATANVGRGLIAGLAVACIGIVADRLIGAWSFRIKERYGLAAG